eukprot:TRINITY_DN2521_c0_g1_i1.p1 TRINITY_DN2521_c0_g1~~TRINITY_DN2521_c0_g1_i1.p1  ORF type:complete len:260 (+),score=50.35 TRINITY_DN2521_c0_g1_i1:70-849(+)
MMSGVVEDDVKTQPSKEVEVLEDEMRQFSELDGAAYQSHEWNYDSEDSLSFNISSSTECSTTSVSESDVTSDDSTRPKVTAEDYAAMFLPKPNVLPFTKPRTIRAAEPKFPKMMMVLEDVLSEDLLQGLHRYSVSVPCSWGIYIPAEALETPPPLPTNIPEVNDDYSREAHNIKFELSANAVRALWIERLKPIWLMEKDNIHGFEVWCLKCEPGNHVGYHLDFAEFPFFGNTTNILPLVFYSPFIAVLSCLSPIILTCC